MSCAMAPDIFSKFCANTRTAGKNRGWAQRTTHTIGNCSDVQACASCRALIHGACMPISNFQYTPIIVSNICACNAQCPLVMVSVYFQHRIAIGLLQSAGWESMYDERYLSLPTLAACLRQRHQDIVRELDGVYAHFGRTRIRIPAAHFRSADDRVYVGAVLAIVDHVVRVMYGASVRKIGKDVDMYNVEPCQLFAFERDATARPYIRNCNG